MFGTFGIAHVEEEITKVGRQGNETELIESERNPLCTVLTYYAPQRFPASSFPATSPCLTRSQSG
jgi:hypothetical protein